MMRSFSVSRASSILKSSVITFIGISLLFVVIVPRKISRAPGQLWSTLGTRKPWILDDQCPVPPSSEAIEGSDTMESTLLYIETLQGNHSLPLWIKDVCPGVYAHFQNVQYSSSFPQNYSEDHGMPYFTTSSAAHSVCSIELSQSIAASIGATVLLHAGSHLGAILHGGPIPWDDDIDLLLPFGFIEPFFNKCNSVGNIHPDVEVKCYRDHNSCLKLALITQESMTTNQAWQWPFVDIFTYEIMNDSLVELQREHGHPHVHKMRMKFDMDHYFPLDTYYFGGAYLLGPQRQVAATRYDFCVCKLPSWWHRKETPSQYKGSSVLDCREVGMHVPFSNGSVLTNTANPLRLIPPEASNVSFAQSHWYTKPEQRRLFDSASQTNNNYSLYEIIPEMDTVEVDNNISLSGLVPNGSITVMELHMEQGERWLESAMVLETYDPDIIIVNSADIGMAQTGQQHIARMMAYRLGMNYAWALASLETTSGMEMHKENNTGGMEHTLGLHGHAILSKYIIMNTTLIRNHASDSPVGSKDNQPAPEIDMDAGMIMLASLGGSDQSLIVGSMNHIQNSHRVEKILVDFVADAPIVLAGGQNASMCSMYGLQHIGHGFYDSPNPAGGQDQDIDIMCSNIPTISFMAAKSRYTFRKNIDIDFSNYAYIAAQFHLKD